MPAGGTPLEVWVDFMGNEIRVGDHVVATRVPDRSAQMYSGQVLGIENVQAPYGNRTEVKIQVEPTGEYSTPYWHHDWETVQNRVTGEQQRTGQRPKAQWIMSRNVLKFPAKSLDIQPEEE